MLSRFARARKEWAGAKGSGPSGGKDPGRGAPRDRNARRGARPWASGGFQRERSLLPNSYLPTAQTGRLAPGSSMGSWTRNAATSRVFPSIFRDGIFTKHRRRRRVQAAVGEVMTDLSDAAGDKLQAALNHAAPDPGDDLGAEYRHKRGRALAAGDRACGL